MTIDTLPLLNPHLGAGGGMRRYFRSKLMGCV